MKLLSVSDKNSKCDEWEKEEKAAREEKEKRKNEIILESGKLVLLLNDLKTISAVCEKEKKEKIENFALFLKETEGKIENLKAAVASLEKEKEGKMNPLYKLEKKCGIKAEEIAKKESELKTKEDFVSAKEEETKRLFFLYEDKIDNLKEREIGLKDKEQKQSLNEKIFISHYNEREKEFEDRSIKLNNKARELREKETNLKNFENIFFKEKENLNIERSKQEKDKKLIQSQRNSLKAAFEELKRKNANTL
ncbi:MAG: hypothetical protein AAB877_00895 [Patescibacteria group bacterium]